MEPAVVNLSDIHPLTGFLRNHKAHIQRLSETGKPEVLTVNGEARVVVQDAAAYQKLLDQVQLAEDVRIIRERLADVKRGEPGVPLDEAMQQIGERLGIEPTPNR